MPSWTQWLPPLVSAASGMAATIPFGAATHPGSIATAPPNTASGCCLDAHVGGASIRVHGAVSIWVPAVEVAQIAVNLLWVYSSSLLGLLLDLLLTGTPNWWDMPPNIQQASSCTAVWCGY